MRELWEMIYGEQAEVNRIYQAWQLDSLGPQGFSKVVKVTGVAAISNRAFSGDIRARLGNRGYIRDFGKTLVGS